MGIILSIVGGGLITIATAIFIEWLRKPRLALSIETPPHDVPANSPREAACFTGEPECYGWNNESYFNNWRTPDWKLDRGTYLVRVVIASSGSKFVGETHRMMRRAQDPLTAFHLTSLPRRDGRRSSSSPLFDEAAFEGNDVTHSPEIGKPDVTR